MPTNKQVERKVYFFQLQRSNSTTLNYIPELQSFDWEEILKAFNQSNWEKHWFADKQYCMSVLEDKQYPILTIGEKLKTQFMQRIDNQHKQLTDLADENIKAGNIDLAQMSAVVFFPRCNSIGYITGSGAAKTAILETFLNTVVRKEGDPFQWHVVPIYTTDGIKEFNDKMKTVHTVHLKYTTQRKLLDSGEHGGELIDMPADVIRKLESDIDVDVRVTIPRRLRTKAAARKLKSMVSKAAPIVSEQEKSIYVEGTTLDDAVLKYDILTHPLILKADVPSCDETRQFTQLVDTLIDVCSQQENSVYELVER